MQVVTNKSCDTCNKSAVCKYRDDVVKRIDNIVDNTQFIGLPLVATISCNEYMSKNVSLHRNMH